MSVGPFQLYQVSIREKNDKKNKKEEEVSPTNRFHHTIIISIIIFIFIGYRTKR